MKKKVLTPFCRTEDFHVIFRLDFRYGNRIQISEDSNAGIRNIKFRSIQNLAIQKDGRGQNKYCASDNRRKGTGRPSIKSPGSFAIAMPSTRLWEKANNSRATAMLTRHVSIQVSTIIPKDHSVSENQSISVTDTIKAIAAGNASLDRI